MKGGRAATALERGLACEADSGRHRGAVTVGQPPVKVVVSKAYHRAHRFLCAPDVATHVKGGGGDPSASQARQRSKRRDLYLRKSVSIRGSSVSSYSCPFAVPFP